MGTATLGRGKTRKADHYSPVLVVVFADAEGEGEALCIFKLRF